MSVYGFFVSGTNRSSCVDTVPAVAGLKWIMLIRLKTWDTDICSVALISTQHSSGITQQNISTYKNQWTCPVLSFSHSHPLAFPSLTEKPASFALSLKNFPPWAHLYAAPWQKQQTKTDSISVSLSSTRNTWIIDWWTETTQTPLTLLHIWWQQMQYLFLLLLTIITLALREIKHNSIQFNYSKSHKLCFHHCTH